MEPSKRIGDYEVLAEIGRGGMGKVFRVRNVLSDRIDAMKVLLPNLVESPELAARFLREIKVLAALNHPNIAALHTALTADNQLVMIMEYVEGQSLAQRLRYGPIPTGQAIAYIEQALDALDYAHRQHVVHRDIKPANMMVTPAGVVKLMDFGIARAKGDQTLTAADTTTGSLGYMSPEQVHGKPTDGRSDLYSVGISLYEMVTGERPFKSNSDFAVMLAQVNEQPRPPIELMPALAPELNAIILKAIEKDPVARFQSAAEFKQALLQAACRPWRGGGEHRHRHLAGPGSGGRRRSRRGYGRGTAWAGQRNRVESGRPVHRRQNTLRASNDHAVCAAVTKRAWASRDVRPAGRAAGHRGFGGNGTLSGHGGSSARSCTRSRHIVDHRENASIGCGTGAVRHSKLGATGERERDDTGCPDIAKSVRLDLSAGRLGGCTKTD